MVLWYAPTENWPAGTLGRGRAPTTPPQSRGRSPWTSCHHHTNHLSEPGPVPWRAWTCAIWPGYHCQEHVCVVRMRVCAPNAALLTASLLRECGSEHSRSLAEHSAHHRGAQLNGARHGPAPHGVSPRLLLHRVEKSLTVSARVQYSYGTVVHYGSRHKQLKAHTV